MENYFKNEIYSHANELYRYAQMRVFNRSDAEDIITAVMEEAWAKKHKFKYGQPAMPLLMTMLKHQIGKYRRQPTLILLPEDDLLFTDMRSVERDVADMLESEENMKAVFEAIDNLDELSAKIITVCVIDGDKVKQAARRFGINYNTALWLKNRALKQLRKTLSDQGIKPTRHHSKLYSFIAFIRIRHERQAITA